MNEDLFNYLLKKFKISKKDFENHRNYYNNHFDNYDNQIYNDIKTRLVHLKNFSEKSWFNKRYDLLLKKYNLFDSIIEVGFSLPYLPLKKAKKLPFLVYIDKFDSAITISKEIINYLKSKAIFIEGDIEKKETWKEIKNDINGKSLVVCIEVLEHLEKPENFWENIKIVSPSNIIVSLPIGPKIPSHNLFFNTDKEAINYLERYMHIINQELISPESSSGRNIDRYKDIIVYGELKK
ncbi:MAG: hypothetical protein AABW79_00740 [Nanoarchaeota archaeon]